jgi:Transposase DDE domain
MWNPPRALSPEEQKSAARTQKARTCFVFLRTIRPELLDADLQQTLAQSSSPEPGGKAPVDAGIVALATLVQAYGPVSDQDAVEFTVLDKRWQRVLDCLGAEHPPCSRGPLLHCRLRLSAHHLDKTLRERPVALAEQTGGCGARQLRAALDSTPRCGAGRGEDTLNLLGHALRKAVGLAAKALATSAAVRRAEAGLAWVGQSSLKAALALAWGAPTARASALRLVLAEVERWQTWLEQQQRLATQESPMQEVLETSEQMVAQDTAPDPEGGAGRRRLKQPVAPDRRIAIEDAAMRHGRKSRAKTFNGCKEPRALAFDSKVPRAVGVCPANHPEQAAVERLAAELEPGAGLFQLDIALGDMASPRMAPWAAHGVHLMARPWPPSGPLFPKDAFTLAFPHGTVTCPNGQTVPMVPGKDAQFPACACDVCPVRAPCTPARLGHGRSLTIREDAQCQQKLRAKIKTQRGRASLRKRTAVEHALAQHVAHRGRRARSKGLRQNQCDGRRHAAVSTLLVAARYKEERQLAS